MMPARTQAEGDWQWPSAADVARLAAALVVAVLLQTTVAPNIRVLGANPDFALVIVVSVALIKGSETGALFGFLTGTFVAIALMEPFGLFLGRVLVPSLILNTLIAAPVYLAVRLWLRGAGDLRVARAR